MLKTILSQVKEFKRVSILTPVFVLGEVILEMVIPLLMASIIDEGVTAGNIDHIKTTGLWMLLLAVVSLCLGLLSARFGAQASAGLARNLRQAMFEKIQTYSFSNIDKFSTSSLITRLTTDVTNVQNAYMMILRMCSRAPASLLVAMVLSFSINAELASIYLVAVVVLGVLLFLIMSRAMKYFKQVFQKYDDMNASVQENVTGIRVVKAYVREDHENKKFQKASQNIYKTFLSAEKILSWNAPLMNFTVYACILLISWLGANMIVGSSLTTGELMNLLTYCMNILMSLMMISMIFVMMSMSVASARRICEVLAGEGAGHTFVLHAKDEAVVRRFALTVPVSRFLVNVPASLGGIGAETALFPALTLGCGAVGGSSSSNNIGPLDLINLRRVAWGSEKPEPQPETPAQPEPDSALIARLTEEILKKLR